MKRLVAFFKRLLKTRKSRSHQIDEAIAEGFKQTLKELGQ